MGIVRGSHFYLHLITQKRPEYIIGIRPPYNEEDKAISFDIIISFKIKDREALYKHIYEEIEEKYKDYDISITLDIDFSD